MATECDFRKACLYGTVTDRFGFICGIARAPWQGSEWPRVKNEQKGGERKKIGKEEESHPMKS